MTVHESADAIRPDVAIAVVVDYDEYLDEPRCPLCAMTLSDAGTPKLSAEQLGTSDDLPVFGWRCNCRRAGVHVVSTIEHAPEEYEPVEATIEDQTVDVGVPSPAIEGVSA